MELIHVISHEEIRLTISWLLKFKGYWLSSILTAEAQGSSLNPDTIPVIDTELLWVVCEYRGEPAPTVSMSGQDIDRRLPVGNPLVTCERQH